MVVLWFIRKYLKFENLIDGKIVMKNKKNGFLYFILIVGFYICYILIVKFNFNIKILLNFKNKKNGL